MLGCCCGWDEPGNLWQGVIRDVAGEAPDQMFTAGLFGILSRRSTDPRASPLVEFGSPIQTTEAAKKGQGIISEIVVFLIDAPIDPSLLKALGIGRPAMSPK